MRFILKGQFVIFVTTIIMEALMTCQRHCVAEIWIEVSMLTTPDPS